MECSLTVKYCKSGLKKTAHTGGFLLAVQILYIFVTVKTCGFYSIALLPVKYCIFTAKIRLILMLLCIHARCTAFVQRSPPKHSGYSIMTVSLLCSKITNISQNIGPINLSFSVNCSLTKNTQ